MIITYPFPTSSARCLSHGYIPVTGGSDAIWCSIEVNSLFTTDDRVQYISSMHIEIKTAATIYIFDLNIRMDKKTQ